MITLLRNIYRVEDLRQRIIFVLLMLIVFRIGTHIPIPGIDSSALSEFFASQAGNILAFFNTFSGGALENLSIFALGVLPYISASIIMQLMTAVFPYLERLAREGDAGRKKITQYTRYGTILLSIIQGYGIASGIQQMAAPSGAPIVISTLDAWSFRLITIITLTAGTAFVMWVGEQINERGIGNGISLIIFAGIVASIPSSLIRTFQLVQVGELVLFVVLVVAAIIVIAMIAVIFMETANRKIPVQYAQRMQGRKMYGGQATHLPLKINASGVIPPIFASSLLAFPATITAFVQTAWVQSIGAQLTPERLLYNVLFVLLIFFFCFFYTAIQFNPIKISEELKSHGGFIPGVRPGKKTAEFLNLVLSRLTFGGATYLSLVCVLPSVLYVFLEVPFFFGGTALLIVVGVALDTSNQIETFLLHQNYDGFIQKYKNKTKY